MADVTRAPRLCFRCAEGSGRAIPADAVDRPCPACAEEMREEALTPTDRFLADKSGTTIVIDDGLCECASWTVGRERCSCGNRRIYVEDRGGSVVVCAD